MTWYNPLSWLSSTEDDSTELYCSNPACEKKIDDAYLDYDRKRGRIYHSNNACQLEAMSYLASQTGTEMTGNIDEISRNKALKLLAKRKLRNGLENILE
jgi:hypothetical protein